MALRKTEFSELFNFASFGIVQFSKFGNFSEISVNFMFVGQKTLFMGQKTLCMGQKTLFLRVLGSKFKKTGSKTGVSEHSEFTENSEFVLFLNIQKNEFKIEF